MSDNLNSHFLQLQSFDATKTGVKGLVDAGITTIPPIFNHPQNPHHNPQPTNQYPIKFPVVDLDNIDHDPIKHQAAVDAVGHALRTSGFFHLVNHGIPASTMQEMLDGARKFFEQDVEERKKWYTRDPKKRVVHNSNFDLYSTAPAANWRDTVICRMAPDSPDPHDLPWVCSDIMYEYTKQVLKLGNTLCRLLSVALGLEANHLVDIDCAEGLTLLFHYYPVCPEPELTYGSSPHTDASFLTILLHDQVNGLQVFNQDQWIDVPNVPGALVVNAGDLLQLISNDRFVSAEHRVLVNSENSRVSVPCFFRSEASSRLYGPIEELLSEDNPPKYRATTTKEFFTHYLRKGLNGTSALHHFRV